MADSIKLTAELDASAAKFYSEFQGVVKMLDAVVGRFEALGKSVEAITSATVTQLDASVQSLQKSSEELTNALTAARGGVDALAQAPLDALAPEARVAETAVAEIGAAATDAKAEVAALGKDGATQVGEIATGAAAAEAATKSLGDRFDAAGKALEGLTSETEEFDRSFGKAMEPTPVDRLKDRIAAADREAAELRREISSGETAVRALGAAAPAALVQRLTDAKRRADELGQAARKAEASINGMGRGGQLRLLADNAATLRGRFSEIEAGAQRIGIAMSAIGAAMVGALGLATKASADFDTEFAAVITVLELADRQLIPSLKKGVRDISVEFGLKLPDAVKALNAAIQSGVAPVDALRFLRINAKAAAAAQAELADVSKLTAAMMATYGFAVDDLESKLDVLFQTQNLGVTTVAELSQQLGDVLPIAAQAGMTFEEVGAAIAAATAQGIKTPQAVTGLRSALNQLLKPSEQAASLAKQLGIDWSASGLRAKGFAATVAEAQAKVREALASGGGQMRFLDEESLAKDRVALESARGVVTKTLGDIDKLRRDYALAEQRYAAAANAKDLQKAAAQNRLIDLANQMRAKQDDLNAARARAAEIDARLAESNNYMVGGVRDATEAMRILVADIEGFNFVSAMSANKGKKMGEAMTAMASAGGTTARAFKDIKDNSPGFTFGQLVAALQVLASEIGVLLLPKLISTAEWLASVVRSVRAWVEENPKLAKFLAVVYTALALFAAAVGALLALLVPLAITIASIGAAAAALGITLGAIALPAALVVAGIAAIIAILVLLFFYWEDVVEVVSEGLKWWGALFAGFYDSLVDLVSGGFLWTMNLFDDFGDWISGWWERIESFFAGGFQRMMRMASDFIQRVKDAANALTDFLGGNAYKAFESVTGAPRTTELVSAEARRRAGTLPSLAGGGIVSGPKSGFLAMLHGTEAVIPLAAGAGDAPSRASVSSLSPAAGGPVTVNVYPSPGMDEASLARKVADHIRRRRGGL